MKYNPIDTSPSEITDVRLVKECFNCLWNVCPIQTNPCKRCVEKSPTMAIADEWVAKFPMEFIQMELQNEKLIGDMDDKK